MKPGPLALVGGDEFRAGNEPQDEVLIAAARPGPAFIVPTAAARQDPAKAVSTARAWFDRLGLDVDELPVLKRSDATAPAIAERAASGRFFYLVGGDPGLVVRVLRDTPTWEAICSAWRAGAALAGSSAGAMALCRWSLFRAGWPDRTRRRFADGLGVVPGAAVVPHFGSFGRDWVRAALDSLPDALRALIGIDEASAAVFHGGGWTAMGRGGVTVIDPNGNERSFASGEPIEGVPLPG
jgi:cyanophycinase